MVRLVFCAFVILASTSVRGQQSTVLEDIRNELFYTTINLEKCTAFYQKVLGAGESSATLTAYQAAAKALIAKHSWNPVTKLSSLKNVQKLLTEAVTAEQDNLEIRFLRFYIENSIPSYLGFSKNMKEDGDILASNIDNVDKMNLDKGISEYIIEYVESTQTNDKKKLKSGILNP